MDDIDSYIWEISTALDCTFVEEYDKMVYESCSAMEFLTKCLWKIDPSTKKSIPSCVYPKSLPDRLRLAQKIAEKLKNLKLRCDAGFHNVAYGSKYSLRPLYLEIIKHLPATLGEEKVGPSNILEVAAEKLDAEPAWLPEFCQKFERIEDGRHWYPDELPAILPLNLDTIDKKDPRKWLVDMLNKEEKKDEEDEPEPSPFEEASDLSQFKPLEKATVSKPHDPELDKEEMERLEALANLQLQYASKLDEYKTGHEALINIRKLNAELQKKIDQYDPFLIEALQNPPYYSYELRKKTAEIKKKTKKEILKGEKLIEEAKGRLKLVLEECEAKGVLKSKEEQLQEYQEYIEKMREESKRDQELIKKLEAKLEKSKKEDNFTAMEKRCKELEDLVRKQENDLQKMIEERQEVRKRQERDDESIDRSFAKIFTALSQQTGSSRDRHALDSFIKIQKYCREFKEIVKANVLLKIEIDSLKDEIIEENRKDYDTQMDRIDDDIEAMKKENLSLYRQCLAIDPTFRYNMD